MKKEIRMGENRIYLGYHDTPQEAADAYEEAAKELHGKFSRIK